MLQACAAACEGSLRSCTVLQLLCPHTLLACPFVCLFMHSLTHAIIHPFSQLSIHASMHSFIHSVSHSFIHCCIYAVNHLFTVLPAYLIRTWCAYDLI